MNVAPTVYQIERRKSLFPFSACEMCKFNYSELRVICLHSVLFAFLYFVTTITFCKIEQAIVKSQPGRQPVRFTGYLPNNQETTYIAQGGLLTFPQFEEHDGYGFENLVERFETGTIQVDSRGVTIEPFKLFLTFMGEMDWNATNKESHVYVHHQSGEDGAVEIMKLPSLEGVVFHS